MNLSTGTRSMELNLALTVSQETLLSQTTDGALDVYDEDEEVIGNRVSSILD